MAKKEKPSLICLPLEALEKREFRELVCDADVVLGIDKDTEEMAIFFGKDALQKSQEKNPLKALRMVGFTLEPNPDQCALLGVSVFFLKGSSCFHDAESVIRKPQGVLQVKIAGEGTISTQWVFRPFSTEIRAKIAQIRDTLKEVRPLSLAKWEEEFREGMHPEQEIALWLHLCKCYLHFTSGRSLTWGEKRDILSVLILAFLKGSKVVLETFRCQTLSRKQLRKIAAFVQGIWKPDAV